MKESTAGNTGTQLKALPQERERRREKERRNGKRVNNLASSPSALYTETFGLPGIQQEASEVRSHCDCAGPVVRVQR